MEAKYRSTLLVITLLVILGCFCLLPGFGSDATSPTEIPQFESLEQGIVGNPGSSSINAEIVAQAPYVVTDPAGSEPWSNYDHVNSIRDMAALTDSNNERRAYFAYSTYDKTLIPTRQHLKLLSFEAGLNPGPGAGTFRSNVGGYSNDDIQMEFDLADYSYETTFCRSFGVGEDQTNCSVFEDLPDYMYLAPIVPVELTSYPDTEVLLLSLGFNSFSETEFNTYIKRTAANLEQIGSNLYFPQSDVFVWDPETASLTKTGLSTKLNAFVEREIATTFGSDLIDPEEDPPTTFEPGELKQNLIMPNVRRLLITPNGNVYAGLVAFMAMGAAGGQGCGVSTGEATHWTSGGWMQNDTVIHYNEIAGNEMYPYYAIGATVWRGKLTGQGSSVNIDWDDDPVVEFGGITQALQTEDQSRADPWYNWNAGTFSVRGKTSRQALRITALRHQNVDGVDMVFIGTDTNRVNPGCFANLRNQYKDREDEGWPQPGIYVIEDSPSYDGSQDPALVTVTELMSFEDVGCDSGPCTDVDRKSAEAIRDFVIQNNGNVYSTTVLLEDGVCQPTLGNPDDHCAVVLIDSNSVTTTDALVLGTNYSVFQSTGSATMYYEFQVIDDMLLAVGTSSITTKDGHVIYRDLNALSHPTSLSWNRFSVGAHGSGPYLYEPLSSVRKIIKHLGTGDYYIATGDAGHTTVADYPGYILRLDASATFVDRNENAADPFTDRCNPGLDIDGDGQMDDPDPTSPDNWICCEWEDEVLEHCQLWQNQVFLPLVIRND